MSSESASALLLAFRNVGGGRSITGVTLNPDLAEIVVRQRCKNEDTVGIVETKTTNNRVTMGLERMPTILCVYCLPLPVCLCECEMQKNI